MNSNITGQWNVIDAGGTRTLLVSSGQHQPGLRWAGTGHEGTR